MGSGTVFLRMWHAIFGHPRASVTWGTFEEGAYCECGAAWELSDYY